MGSALKGLAKEAGQNIVQEAPNQSLNYPPTSAQQVSPYVGKESGTSNVIRNPTFYERVVPAEVQNAYVKTEQFIAGAYGLGKALIEGTVSGIKENPVTLAPGYSFVDAGKQLDSMAKQGYTAENVGLYSFSVLIGALDIPSAGRASMLKKVAKEGLEELGEQIAKHGGVKGALEYFGEKSLREATEATVKKGGKEAAEKISITLVSETGAVATKLSKDEAIVMLTDLGEKSAKNALDPHEMHIFNTLLNEVNSTPGWKDVLEKAGFGEAKGILPEAAPAAGKAAAKEAVEAGKRSLAKRFEKGVSEIPVSGEVVETVEGCMKSLKMKGTLKEIVEVDPFKAVGYERPEKYAHTYLFTVEQEGKEFVLGLTKGGKGGFTGGAVQVVEDATVRLGIKTLPKHAKVIEIGGEAYTLVPMAEFKGLR